MNRHPFVRWARAFACVAGILLLMVALPTESKASDAKTPVWLVMGDSLSAAYGIPAAQGWVALLQQRLTSRGYRAQVINASVSGETTSGGLARLPALLQKHQPQVVLIELGGNDGLRALPVARLRDNLTQLIALSRAAGATPVVFEMQIPANYGVSYTGPFTASFAEIAKREKARLAPFILAPIATDTAAFQADGIHPTAAAQPKMLDTVWPALEAVAKATTKAR